MPTTKAAALSSLPIAALGLALAATPAAAADGMGLDGASLSLLWAIPFVGMLLSIAVIPLVAGHFWHHHYGKVALFWALTLLAPFIAVQGAGLAVYEVAHAGLLEYIPFIILLFSLFTISGGILLTGNLKGSPAVNTGLLAIGTVLASVIGTTGASMVLIRPLLRANDERRHNVHTVVFFIFLVSNIGGSLTPLGDPPLFLGFLKGVDFFWTTQHLFHDTAVVAVILLVAFYLLDRHFYGREDNLPAKRDPTPGDERLGLRGLRNLPLLGGVIAAILMSALWKPGIEFNVLGTHVPLPSVARDVALVLLALVSLKITPAFIRERNGFDWEPIREVAKLFAAIFLTIIPVIAILKAGADGALSPLVALVTQEGGEPFNAGYFWMTGLLSGFLDNAPTYLVFFNLAGGDPAALMTTHAVTLEAISAGAVFMGALTYIGNAPNFMVLAIAKSRGVAMPSFFGYMAWSGIFLLPCFALLTWLYFL
ncbi:sodium:proton antiporter [Ancylobacter amanitiformis]|uniref:Na+/H+ antiporter NhaD/arsenite permease-like protein n=1 Tax=Ancylobacter amanitiformis TaxID=217069 RepID=A0ABU0LTM0_9HYPH|nr:sodium:proton antiporter [Ancylobacter amanitiformis]MDQ0512063.1 Na+/H+ antiporter NhaD/arsenite permease-like protein [Ancylobacter amanitiformis]